MWTSTTPPFWLALYPFVRLYRSDFGGAAPGLIWAKLKSEFTMKNFALKGPQMTTALGTSSRIKMIVWNEF